MGYVVAVLLVTVIILLGLLFPGIQDLIERLKIMHGFNDRLNRMQSEQWKLKASTLKHYAEIERRIVDLECPARRKEGNKNDRNF